MQLMQKQPCLASGEFFHPFVTMAQAKEFLSLPVKELHSAAQLAASEAATAS